MNNEKESPEPGPKKSYHPMPTPEEIKLMDEEMAEAIRKTNEYTKKMGWTKEEIKAEDK